MVVGVDVKSDGAKYSAATGEILLEPGAEQVYIQKELHLKS